MQWFLPDRTDACVQPGKAVRSHWVSDLLIVRTRVRCPQNFTGTVQDRWSGRAGGEL